MWEWLLSPIDATRAHEVGMHLSWHARSMVLAWGVLVPLGIVAARYFKVLPGQRWPRDLDNPAWWIAHRGMQYTALCVMLAGLALVLLAPAPAPSLTPMAWVHRLLGWGALSLAAHQLMSGLLRGTKGGPTDPRGQLRGDHYDMTRRRIVFEHLHKSLGYTGLCLAMAAILTGMWQANAPFGLWLVLLVWWGGLGLFVLLVTPKIRRVPTYQAIWGPDPEHPGNHHP